MHRYSYLLGSRHACVKLGMDEGQVPPPEEEEGELSEEELAALLAEQEGGGAEAMPGEEQPLMEAGAEGEDQVPEELLQALLAEEGMEGGMPGEEGQAPTADMFVDFANSDATADEADPNMMPTEEGEQDPTTWSGAASMEGGDAATRGQEMGLPKFNGV